MNSTANSTPITSHSAVPTAPRTMPTVAVAVDVPCSLHFLRPNAPMMMAGTASSSPNSSPATPNTTDSTGNGEDAPAGGAPPGKPGWA